VFKKQALIPIFILLFVLSGRIASHTLWLNLSDYSPERRRSIVYFGWGHRYPVDDFLDQEKFLKRFFLIKPSGEVENLTPNPGGFLATQVKFLENGTYIISAELKPGFYTMYMEKGKIHHKLGPKTGVKGVILSQYYEQYAKAIVNVSEGSSLRPIGQKLEIVPLENPGKLKCGDFLQVQVLFENKPVKYCPVLATYSGFSTGEDFAYATSTDNEGIARIRLLHWGPWLIKVNYKLPPTEEFKDKCDQLSYTATLTFEVQ